MPEHIRFLYLIRHAEAAWADAGYPDHDRPLTDQGRDEADRLADWLAERRLSPDIILTSSAVRAQTTAHILANKTGYAPADLISDSRIYEADLEDLLTVLSETDDTNHSMMLIGHNPGLTHLVHELASEPIRDLPPTGMARLKLTLPSWHNIDRAKADLLDLVLP